MATRIKTEGAHVILHNTTTSKDIFDLGKTEVGFRYNTAQDKVFFVWSGTETRVGLNIDYAHTDIVNGDDSDNAFASMAAFQTYLRTNTGFDPASVSGALDIYTIDEVSENIQLTSEDNKHIKRVTGANDLILPVNSVESIPIGNSTIIKRAGTGQIDGVGIWDKILVQQEIDAIYAKQLSGEELV